VVRHGKFAAAVLGVVLMATPAAAERDPAYAQARAAGQVGEKPDGYLGVVTGGSAIAAMVDDINIKRKAAYTREAQLAGATIEQFTFTTGCRLIAATRPGEKYQSPDGSWQTRGADAPIRDSRCP
jgi:uncharacterized protein YdbL (DUF1318 family)